MDILISSRHVNLLRDYSKKTGLSIDLCVHDALVDWFRKGAPGDLGRLGLPHSTRVRAGASFALPSGIAPDGSDSGGIVRRIRSLLRSNRT
jgi:hypothetical protein